MPELATGITSDPEIMDGEPVVEGTRVRVATLYRVVEDEGLDPETTAERYDLSKAAVYRALAYYYDNPEEMARQEQIRQDLKQQALDSGAKTLGDLRREHEQGEHNADAD
jgi:uncharacterized protein (DUF433 family)